MQYLHLNKKEKRGKYERRNEIRFVFTICAFKGILKTLKNAKSLKVTVEDRTHYHLSLYLTLTTMPVGGIRLSCRLPVLCEKDPHFCLSSSKIIL